MALGNPGVSKVDGLFFLGGILRGDPNQGPKSAIQVVEPWRFQTSYPHLSRKLLNCIYCTNPFKYENFCRNNCPDGNLVPIDGFKRFPGAGSEKFTEEAKGVYRRNYRFEGQDFHEIPEGFCCPFQPSTSLKKLTVS